MEITTFIPSRFASNSYDPFQPPDRRWQRCQYLIEHGRCPSTRWDDSTTVDAWRFFLDLSRCEDDAARKRLEGCFPGIAEAYRFFSNAKSPQRWELEARLLARQDDNVIGGKCGMTAAAVTSYHDLYFDVRPRLTAGTYIGTVVLAGSRYKAITQGDDEALLKTLGYELGGEMVDRLLDCLRDSPNVPTSLDSLDLDALRQLRAKLLTKALVLIETTPASATHPAIWQWLVQRFEEARRVAQEQGDDETAVLGSIRAMVDIVDAMGRGDIGQQVGSQRRAEAADVRGVVETVPA